MALGSTQPLTKMSTRNISWGKGGLCVRMTTLPPSYADCLEIWVPEPPGTLRACPDLYRDCFTFTKNFLWPADSSLVCLVFFRRQANANLVPQLQVAMHATDAALPIKMRKSCEILVFMTITKRSFLWNLSPCGLWLVEQQAKAADRLTK